mmetsp:Transcript_30670/g.42716  ORF Transcript_30670/g.42716 Transcript_30670/m.42716 type:complete len:241 (-) Transcript_30670:192-914(-)
MDYSLILAYRDEKLQAVKNGEISEETKELLRTSKFVCVLKEKVRIYFLGVIDFLQDWNIKKDIARCIKACAPHPLSTVPPPLYAEQFNTLAERMKGDAEEFKIVEDQKDNDVLGSIEVKLKEEAEKVPEPGGGGAAAEGESAVAIGGAIPVIEHEPQAEAADQAKEGESGSSNKEQNATGAGKGQGQGATDEKEKGEEKGIVQQEESKDQAVGDKLNVEEAPMDNVPIGSTPKASELLDE